MTNYGYTVGHQVPTLLPDEERSPIPETVPHEVIVTHPLLCRCEHCEFYGRELVGRIRRRHDRRARGY